MLTTGGIIVSIIVTIVFVSFYEKKTNAFCKSNKKLHGKTALVTGGTSGMGLEIAKDFAARGARVIIACPFNNEGEKANEIIIQETGNKKVTFKNLDLGSFKSVRDFAADILNSEERLDILVNNAGVGLVPKRTVDGLNKVMQINYYGHFLLTILLLPILKKTPSRIVNMSSVAHRIGKIKIVHMNNTKLSKLWYRVLVYGSSKLYLILFARELTRKLQGTSVTANSVDPGAVGTGIWYAVAGRLFGYIISFFLSSVFKTPLEGAQTAIHVAVDDDLDKVSGEVFKNCKKIKAASRAYSEKHAKLLWDDSVKVCKLSDKEVEQCLN